MRTDLQFEGEAWYVWLLPNFSVVYSRIEALASGKRPSKANLQGSSVSSVQPKKETIREQGTGSRGRPVFLRVKEETSFRPLASRAPWLWRPCPLPT